MQNNTSLNQSYTLGKLQKIIRKLSFLPFLKRCEQKEDKKQAPRDFSANSQIPDEDAPLEHELRAPLVDLMALIHLECQGRLPDFTYQLMVQRTQHLLDLVEHLLSNGESLSKSKKEWLDPDDLLCDLVRSLSTSALKKELYLSYSPNLQACKQIYANKQALQILIQNILSNAINCTEKGGTGVLLSFEEDKLKVTIEDTGRGIADAPMQYLKSHHQGQVQRTKSGHGIGLQLARTAADALNADIQIKHKQSASEPSAGEGDLFSSLEDDLPITGTIVEIEIPGVLQSDQLALFTMPIKANLSMLADQFGLLKQLKNMGVEHDGYAPCTLRSEEKPTPHLVLIDAEGKSFRLQQPCSYKKLCSLFSGSAVLSKKLASNFPQKNSTASAKVVVPKKRIALVVDDSSLSRRAAVHLLESGEWLTHEVGSIAAGKNALRKMNYDLVIQDASLPDGQEAISDNIPLIAMSASGKLAKKLSQEKGLWIGSLTKPVEAKAMQNILTLWKKTAPAAAWEVGVGIYPLEDKEQALEMAREALADMLARWRLFMRAISSKRSVETHEMMHYFVGGLRYTGLAALTKCLEDIYLKTSEEVLPKEDDIDKFRRVLHQTLAVIAHQ